MKLFQAAHLKTIALTKVMETVSRGFAEQAFDNMSEESEKKILSLRNCCGLFQVKAWLSRPKKHGGFTPRRGYPGDTFRPQIVRWPRIA